MMKPYVFYWLPSLLGLLACQPDDQELSSTPVFTGDIATSESVLVGNLTRYAGYGYELTEGERYRSPFTDNSVLPSNLVGTALEADFEVITSKSALDAFVSRGRTYGVRAELSEKYKETLAEFGLGPQIEASAKRKIIDRMVLADSVLSAVARITVRRLRYDVDDPWLTPQAQALIDQGEIDEFFGNYGTTYVSSRVVGGEVYYVYNFDFSKSNEIRESERESMVRAYVSEMFNTQSSERSSERSENPLGRFSVKGGSVSTINSFVGGMVKTVDEFNHEITRIQDHLTTYPQYANTVDMSLTSYTSLMPDNEELQAGFERYLTCFAEYYQWQQLADELNYIREATHVEPLREAAEDQLSGVLRNIGSMYLCRGVSGDLSAYQWITDWRGLEEATVPLYRYYSEELQKHYYTADPGTVPSLDRGDSYALEDPERAGGVECRVFQNEEPGTTFVNDFQGIIGYIYDQDNSVDSRMVRPLYYYYNSEKQDAIMTTDPVEQFDLSPDLEEFPPQQADGYDLLTTLGYAISQQ